MVLNLLKSFPDSPLKLILVFDLTNHSFEVYAIQNQKELFEGSTFVKLSTWVTTYLSSRPIYYFNLIEMKQTFL